MTYRTYWLACDKCRKLVASIRSHLPEGTLRRGLADFDMTCADCAPPKIEVIGILALNNAVPHQPKP